MMDTFHPDHLKPGDMVGPWRIVESLGSGNFGHAFLAERAGELFTLKMAVRPAPELPQETPEKARDEGEVDSRMRHEGAILMANASHPGLPRLRAVDRWPHPTRGYLFIVTDHVPGELFHAWRERIQPSAAQLTDFFIEVVRAVGQLHAQGILIRDFKSDHVIVHSQDHKPVIVDLGSAWLPGGSTLTVGLAPGTPHVLPPECITFIREGSWKQGARFEASQAGDLYQLGVFMYEALTEGWPFDPRLTKEELLAAIENVMPRPPHRINPEVPASLSRIVMRLLEKQPEARYESAEALLQALWEANKERSTGAWKVPLRLPPEGPAPVTQEEVEERRLLKQEAMSRAQEAREQKAEELSREQALEQLSILTQGIEEQLLLAEEKAARRKKWWRRIALGVGMLLLVLVLCIAGWVWFAPATNVPAASEKGSLPVFTLTHSRPVKALAAWLCATFSVGCPAAQIRPLPEDCPREAVESMTELNIDLNRRNEFQAILDINQPGTAQEKGVYQSGKIVGRVVPEIGRPESQLPGGTLLYGQIWTEGLTKYGKEAVYLRYTEALLPDGRRVPVCLVLGYTEAGVRQKENLMREETIEAVDYWP